MGEGSTHQLPLPDVLRVVRQQVPEPYAAQNSVEAHQQQQQRQRQQHQDAVRQLQAVPAAQAQAWSAADESVVAQQVELPASPLLTSEQDWVAHSPDAIQLRMMDSIQLGQMHSTADLALLEAASEAGQEAAAASESSPDPGAAPTLPGLVHSDLCLESDDMSSVDAAQGEGKIAGREEAEAAVLSLSAGEGALGDSSTSDSSASATDSLQQQHQPDWQQQWAQMQLQQQQQRRQHAVARSKKPQPSKLMLAVAAAAAAEQSEPIRAIFERHGPLGEFSTAPPSAGSIRLAISKPDAAFHDKASTHAHVERSHAAECSPGSSSIADDACALLHHVQAGSYVFDGFHSAQAGAQHAQHTQHARGAQRAQQAQHAQHSQGDQRHSDKQAEDPPATSKRSLGAAAKPPADDSSAETSPEAARNSRMKMRRTSGEFQQVLFPCIVHFTVTCLRA